MATIKPGIPKHVKSSIVNILNGIVKLNSIQTILMINNVMVERKKRMIK